MPPLPGRPLHNLLHSSFLMGGSKHLPCKGGSSQEKSLSLFIREDLSLAMWSCFRAKCDWRGSAKVSGEVKAYNLGVNQPLQVKEYRKISERDLLLEPLCEEVEGEMDKLSMEEAGYRNCVSVPDGAPAKVSEDIPVEKEASRIILATDADPPGQALAEEIARRVGKERVIKDNTENAITVLEIGRGNKRKVLMYLGPDALRKVIETAELYPIRGLFTFSDFFHEIDAYYHCSRGFELGVSTGWKALDELYNVVPGELTLITGVPNSGKSEWIDALLCNISESHEWKFVLCSMENKASSLQHDIMFLFS
ncbi:putative DNA helicase, DnaB-like, C-terminal [Cocos nucifera]|uniref:Putative DNA helicase, DnaB-like, C-terminal n=1 Tax=Cocos nucifera TaxID=13894 RepID=A0A8K0IR91_COCNU|nr:putative DNA helicase, DnaB-like, C-terminal [Cocos nucifera]